MKTYSILIMMLLPSLGVAATPERRAHHTLVFDEGEQRVLLSGGSSPRDQGTRFEFFNDLWVFENDQWRLLGHPGEPLSGDRQIFDPRCDCVASVGGYLQQPLARHRLLRQQRFVLSPEGSPPAAAEPGLAYDQRRKQLVLFGGSTGPRQVSGETWVHQGKHWRRLDIDSPPPRQVAVMAYLPGLKRTLLFGGMNGDGKALADLWLFDGKRWSEQTVRHAPSARSSAGFAVDSKRSLLLIFGGMNREGFLGDTWEFDGREWRELPVTGPSARAMGQMAYDRQHDRFVLFGGRSGWPDGDHSDTWVFDHGAWRRIDDQAESESASIGGSSQTRDAGN